MNEILKSSIKMSETGFLKLPVELVFEILKCLDGLDLLTMRRACRKTKEMVDSFKNGNWTGYEVSLTSIKEYKKYQNQSLQIPNIHLDRYSLFLTEFLNDCAPNIKKLRIGNYSGCQTDDEFYFFSAFTNLKELQIDRLQLELSVEDLPARIPLPFKTLQFLNIKARCNLNPNEVKCIKELINFCSQTTTLKFPYLNGIQEEQIYKFLIKVVDHPERQTLNGVKIKWIDMERMSAGTANPARFFNFLKFCVQRRIKLMNLDSIFMDGYEGGIEDNECEELINKTIVTLLGIEPHGFLHFGWDNLEGLTVESDEFARLINDEDDPEFEQKPSPPKLPKLNKLTIKFNSKSWELEGFKELNFSLNLLFPDGGSVIRRTGLTELNLEIDWFEDKLKSLILSNMVDAQKIIWNGPNLKKLRIENWKTNQWKELFQGLPSLEELSVEDCNTFTDWKVVGLNPNKPDFHNLKGLKKLTLKLDYMHRLTDKAFKEVFSKMSLIELKLIGGFEKDPLSVTLDGILALLDGPFAASVRKLSFRELRLKDVSSEKLEGVKRLFPFYK